MILGFTGTRHGMTAAQREAVVRLLDWSCSSVTTLHHGLCVGADQQMHELVRERAPRAEIHGWPGRSAAGGVNELEAKCTVDVLHLPLTHFARNRHIVTICDFLIATPFEEHDPGRGGTWYTIGFAKKIGRRHAVIAPAGHMALQ